jgi:acyl transferase domain-containing protein
VVSGPAESIEALEKQLTARGVNCQRLHTSHAFHSEMMEPVLRPFTEEVRRLRLSPPRLPFLSNVTGTWITPEEAVDPQYWARHLRGTVRFSAGMAELLSRPELVLLEVGPGRTLATLARRQPGCGPEQAVLTSMRHPQGRQSDEAMLLEAAGRLWMAGVKVDWKGLFSGEARRRVPLPTYPFERRRYWIAPRTLLRVPAEEGDAGAGSEQAPAPAQAEAPVRPASSTLHPRPALATAFLAPRNEVEQRIAALWQGVLGIDAIGVHDDFFELGGDSLLGTQIVNRLREMFPVELSMRSLLVDAPTVARLAELIEELLIATLEAMGDDELDEQS